MIFLLFKTRHPKLETFIMNEEKKISFLPEEMKKKEANEQKRKQPAVEAGNFHIPEPEKKAGPANPPQAQVKTERPSFWMKVFGSPEKRAEQRKKKEEKKKKKIFDREAARRKKEEARRARQEAAKRQADAAALKKKEAFLKPAVSKIMPSPPQVPLPPAVKKSAPPSPPATIRQEKKQERKVDQVSQGVRVSLLSEEMLFPAEKRFTSKLWVFILTQCGVILILLVAYFWMVWQESQVKTTEGNINEQLAAVDALTAQKESQLKDAKGLQMQAGVFKDLLDAHVYWTQFLAGLEKNTVQGVYFTSIAADANGGVVLAAHAPNYETVARQLVALKKANDFASSASITSATGEEGDGGILKGVSFDIHLEIIPKVFHK